MNTFHLVISSVGETQFDGAAVSATFPGSEGEFTLLAHHEPFVSTLAPGRIIVRGGPEGTKEFSVDSGILECAGNRAVALL